MKTKILLLGVSLAFGGLVWVKAQQNGSHPGHHMAQPTAEENTEVDATAVKEVAVSLKDFKFSPKLLKIKAGTKVTWTNKETVSHTVTADKGAFDSGNMDQNQTFSFTFDQPGTYAYHCAFHGSAGGGMAGTIKVTK